MTFMSIVQVYHPDKQIRKPPLPKEPIPAHSPKDSIKTKDFIKKNAIQVIKAGIRFLH
jgi:hypothetical protein